MVELEGVIVPAPVLDRVDRRRVVNEVDDSPLRAVDSEASSVSMSGLTSFMGEAGTVLRRTEGVMAGDQTWSRGSWSRAQCTLLEIPRFDVFEAPYPKIRPKVALIGRGIRRKMKNRIR